MIIYRGRKLLIGTGQVPDPDPDPDPDPQPGSGVVNLTVTLDSAAVGITSSIPLLKYNKSKLIMIDWDDALIGGYEATKAGGFAFPSGTGQNIPYRGGVAVNGNYPHSAAKIQEIIAAGWDIMNHSTDHEPYVDLSSIMDVHNRILSDAAYKMNCGVVPTNYAGYHAAWESQGYLASDTQNAGESGNWDGYSHWPTPDWGPMDYTSVPVLDFYVIRRDFVNDWLDGTSNTFFSNITGSINMVLAGTHEFSGSSEAQQAYIDWLSALSSSVIADRLLFCSLREFIEYTWLRNNIVKSQVINGNTAVITLDYSDIPDNISWRDLSLIVGGGQAIQDVVCDNDDFDVAFNPSTRLINLYNRKTIWE